MSPGKGFDVGGIAPADNGDEGDLAATGLFDHVIVAPPQAFI